MKRLLSIAFLLAAGSVSAQDIVTNLVVYAKNLTSQNLANRYITLTPTDANTAGPWLVSAEPVKQKADTNGQTIFTNVVNGYYTLTLASTPPTTYSLAITNGAADSVNVTNYISSSPGANGIGAAYTKSESNQRFLADAVAGTGITLETNTVSNRKLVTINSSASGGLSNLTDTGSAQLSLTDDTEIRGDATVTFADSNGDDALVIDTTAPRLHAMGDVQVAGNLYSTNAVTVSGLLSGADATFSAGITNHSEAGFVGNAVNLTNLMRIVNVMDYGAVGDGVADDTDAIQAALLVAQGGYLPRDLSDPAGLITNGVLYFPAGTFVYDQAIIITNNFVTVLGSGRERTVLFPAEGVIGISVTNGARHVTLNDFTVQGHTNGLGVFIGGLGAPYYSPTAGGSWPIHAHFTIKDFEVGLEAWGVHNGKFDNEIYGCRIGLVATQTVNGCEFTGFYNNYTDTAAEIGGWKGSRLLIKHWDTQQESGGSNVVRVVGGLTSSTISGRAELHKTNSVGIRFMGNSQIANLALRDLYLEEYSNVDAWALYFGDNYTNGTVTATINMDTVYLNCTDNTYGGAIRLPHATSVRMLAAGVGNQPLVSLFEGTSLTYRTNYYVGPIESFYGNWTAYTAPNSFPEYSHRLYFRRPSTDTPDQMWINYYTGNDNTVDKVDLLSLPILDAAGGVAKTNAANIFTLRQSVISPDNFPFIGTSSAADSTTKTFRLGTYNYDTDVNPLLMLFAYAQSGNGTLYYGGGSSVGSPFETHLFYTGESGASGAGAPVMGIYRDGGVSIGSVNNAPADPGDGNLAVVGTLSVTNFASPTNNPVDRQVIVATGTNGATKWASAPVVYQSWVQVPHTGTTDETTLASVTIPGGSVGKNGSISVFANFSANNDASGKTYKWYLGGVDACGASPGFAITSTINNSAFRIIGFRNSDTLKVTQGTTTALNPWANTGTTNYTFSVDTTTNVVLEIKATLADANDIMNLEGYRIEVNHKE